MARERESKGPIRIRMQTFLLLVSTLAVLVVLVFISLISYTNSIAMMNGSIDGIRRSELYQTGKKLELGMNEIKSITQVIANDDELLKDLTQYDVNLAADKKYDNYLLTKEIESSLSQLKLHNKNVEAIVVLTRNAVFTTTGAATFYNVRFDTVVGSPGIYDVMKRSTGPHLFELDAAVRQDIIVPTVHTSLNILLSQASCGSLLRRGATEYGCVFVIARKNLMDDIFSDMKKVAVYNSDDRLAWSNTPQLVNGTAFRTVGSPADDIVKVDIDAKGGTEEGFLMNTFVGGWKILYLKDIDDFKAQLEVLRNTMLILLLLSLFLTVPISGFLLRSTFRLLSDLVAKLREYRASDENSLISFESEEKRPMSLRRKLMAYFLATLVIPVLVFTTLFHIASIRIMESEIEKSITVNFMQMRENIESLLLQNDTIGRSIVYDPIVQRYILSKPEERIASNEIFNRLKDKMTVGQYYNQVSIYDADGVLILSNINGQRDRLDESYRALLDASKGETVWTEAVQDEYRRWHVYALIKIRYIKDYVSSSPSIIGYARIGIEEDYLKQMYRNSLGEGVDVFLQTETGRLVSTIDERKIGTEVEPDLTESGALSAGGRYLFLKEPLGNAPWFLVERYSYEKIRSESNRVLFTNIALTLAIIFVTALLLWYLSFLFVRPLNRFRERIEKTGVNDSFEMLPETGAFSEVHELVGAYNEMVQRIENLIDEVLIAKMARRELEGQKRELELIALQAQINPHFLCNTLETIKWTIYDKDVQKATTMIDSLNNLFKYGISRMESVITIDQEIRYAKAYTEIVRLRSSNRIRFIWDIDEALLPFRTIKLVLQPIIENAIQHGLVDHTKGGTIRIGCHGDEDEIIFTVEDDGVGLEPEKLEEIRNRLEDHNAFHIGLNNVHARVRLYYGEKCGLEIESLKGQGTVVRIRLPRIA